MVSIEKSQMDHNDSDAGDRKEHYLSVWLPVLTIIHGYKLYLCLCQRTEELQEADCVAKHINL